MKDSAAPEALHTENVLRYEEPKEGKSREVLQIGADYISSEASPEADAEMITMAIEAMRDLGLELQDRHRDVGFLRPYSISLRYPPMKESS
jgi:histidyl-tRNA synthetase